MRPITLRVHVLAAAIALGAPLGGCFTGPAPVATGPAMRLSATSLAFAGPAGGADPAPQTITVDDGGAGTLAPPSTLIAYRSGGGWLGAAVTGSAPPYAITFQATIGALAPGTYAATVEVDSAGASNAPLAVAVTLTVGSSSQPTIALSPASVVFTATAGADPAAQTVTVSNAGAGTLAPPAASIAYLGQEKGWLSATVSGTAAPFAITLQPSVAGLPARPSPTFATVSVDCPGASNTPQSIAVQLTVR